MVVHQADGLQNDQRRKRKNLKVFIVPALGSNNGSDSAETNNGSLSSSDLQSKNTLKVLGVAATPKGNDVSDVGLKQRNKSASRRTHSAPLKLTEWQNKRKEGFLLISRYDWIT